MITYALIIVGVSVVGLIAWGAIKGYRSFEAGSKKRIELLRAKYHAEVPVEGTRYVTIDYHVSWGIFNAVTRLHLEWRIRDRDALSCLSELLRFNLRRGVWGLGAVYVPFLAWFRYRRERARVIRSLAVFAVSQQRGPVHGVSGRSPFANNRGVPESRDYVHAACGATTTVDGYEFLGLSDPFPPCERTYCGECCDDFPVADFVWEDTGESIADYYERHSASASRLERTLGSRAGLLLFVIAGVLSGVAIGLAADLRLWWAWSLLIGVLASLIGAAGGLIAWLKWYKAKLIMRVCNVADSRLLD